PAHHVVTRLSCVIPPCQHRDAERYALRVIMAPATHKCGVIRDKAIHETCGEVFWQRIAENMRTHFQNEKFSHALVEAIKEIGKVLAAHFPKTSTNANELPNDIVQG